MPETLEFMIPAEPKYLKINRLSIKLLCELIGFSTVESNNITLAIDEACSNVIRHAYNGPSKEPIHIKCNIYGNKIEFLIRDFGRKANVDQIKSRELDEIRPGGLGVHLIKTVMDEVMYDTNFEKGNQLKLIKHFKGRK
ncbi:ATP-binding protein [candidate division KSB1 bacterium]|nr:ATP-binding protein [candidate division KSB1 bacterium]